MRPRTETSSAWREDGEFGRHDVCKGHILEEDKVEGHHLVQGPPPLAHCDDKGVHLMPGEGHELGQDPLHLRHSEDKGGHLRPLEELRKFSKRILMLSRFTRRVQEESAKRTRKNKQQVLDSQTLPIRVIVALKLKLIKARQRIKEKKEHTRRKWALHPDGKIKTRWDLITTGLLIYTIFEIPFHVAFIESSCKFTPLDRFNLTVDIVFCLDIVLGFNTGFLKKKTNNMFVLVDDRRQIAQRYLSGWFWTDVLSSVPLDVFVCSASSSDEKPGGLATMMRYIKISRFIKLARLIKFGRMLSKWQGTCTSATTNNGIKIFKLFVGLMMIMHMMGCLWFIVKELQDCGEWENFSLETAYGCECSYSLKETHPTLGSCLPRNWLYIYDPHLHDYGSTGSKYITCIYFVAISLATIGFGDILPENDTERAVQITITLVGAVVFAFVIGSVSEIAQQGNKFEESISHNLHYMSDLLEHRNASKELRSIVLDQMSYSIICHRTPRHSAPPLPQAFEEPFGERTAARPRHNGNRCLQKHGFRVPLLLPQPLAPNISLKRAVSVPSP